jgi:hypothetical protein
VNIPPPISKWRDVHLKITKGQYVFPGRIQIDFVGWVFNASTVLKERAEMMALHEGGTYERDAEKCAPYAQRSLDFNNRITNALSKKMVRKVKNRWDVDIWPWDRDGFQRPPNRSLQ